ncbi:hypothetical protein [Palleronia abyssalis]|nr:hypothetical protein [Palleronia abyssalis]
MQRQTPSSFLLIAAIAGGIGFVAFVALMVVGNFTVSPAAFLAILIALGAAIILFFGFFSGPERGKPDLRAASHGQLGDRTVPAGTAGVQPGSATTAPSSVGNIHSDNQAEAIGATHAGRDSGTVGVGRSGATAAPTEAAGAGTLTGTTPSPDHTGDVAGGGPSSASGGMPDASLEEKAKDDTPSDRSEQEQSKSDAPAVEEPSATPSPTPDATEVETDDPKWKSSQLAGSQELADRKGDWKYEGDTDSQTKTAEIGTEPARMAEPREGGADDLKRIKGIGPKLEDLLHSMGIYHYDQIAAWSDQELAWIDENLEQFKGRASRDDWRPQAKELSGGTSA